jgi:protein-disulfide isomerase
MATLLLAVGAISAAQSPSRKTRGIPVASITIELFSDFQCPACKALHEQTLKPLIADYVDKGRVYLVNRDFPLPIHAYARQAALLACAAAHIGKYEPVADALFANQDAWSKDGKVEEVVSKVMGPAEARKMHELVKSAAIAAEVDSDIQKGRDAHLQQTPTLIVMHKSKSYPVSGAVSYPILRRFLDQLLAQ